MAVPSKHSLPFIVWNEKTGKYSVSDEAAEYLCSFDGKIAVTIVAGRYRSGKSFLMNQLLGDADGFSVGHTVESHTRGIWLCSKAMTAETATGEKVPLLFMDSEGLGAADKNIQHDTIIFSLASLLCSTLIFNGSSSIDEASIQNLGFIANLTKHIRLKSNSAPKESKETDDTSMEDFNRFFPSFIWVLRDFLLALIDDEGNEMTPDDYMESALFEKDGYDKDTMARNRIRKCVKGFFRDRHCFTLVRPLDEESDLQDLEHIPSSSLRAEFRENLAKLRSFMLKNARPKEVGGRLVNGSMLVHLAKAYVEAINSGGMPSIADAWESAAAQQSQRACQAAFDSYKASMTPIAVEKATGPDAFSLPVDEVLLEKRHERAREQSLQMFAEMAPAGAAASTDKLRQHLSSLISGFVAELRQSNVDASSSSCKTLIRAVEKSVFQPVLQAEGELNRMVQGECEHVVDEAEHLATSCTEVLDDFASMEDDFDTSQALTQFDALFAAFKAIYTSEHTSSCELQTRNLWTAWQSFVSAYNSKARGPSAQIELLSSGLNVFQGRAVEAAAARDACLLRMHGTSVAVLEATRSALQYYVGSTSNLFREYADTRSQNSMLAIELNAATATVTSLRNEMDHLQSENNTTKTALQQEKDGAAALKSALSSAEKSLQSQQSELAESKQAISAAQSQGALLQGEVSELRQQLQTLQQSKQQVSNLLTDTTSTNTRLTSEVEATRTDLEAARQQLLDAKRENERLRGLHEGAVDDTSRAQRTIERLRDDVAMAHKQNDELLQQLEKVNSSRRQADASQGEIVTELTNLRMQLQSKSRDLAAITADEATLRAELERLDAERQLLLQEKEEQTEEANQLRDQMSELSAHVATLVHDSATLAALREQETKAFEEKVTSSQIDLEAAEAVSDELEQDLKTERLAHQEAAAGLTAALAQVAQLTAALRAVEQEKDSTLVAGQERSSTLMQQNQELQGQITELKQEIAVLRGNISELKDALDASTSASAATAEALGALQEELSVATSERDEAHTTIQTLEAQIAELKTSCESLNMEMEIRSKAQTSTTQAAGDFAKRIATMQAELNASEAQLREAYKARDELAAQLAEQREAVAVAETEVSQLSLVLSKSQASEGALTSAVQDLESSVAALKSRCVIAEAECEAASHRDSQSTKECESLRIKLAETSVVLDKLLAEKKDLELRNQEVGAVGRHTHASVEGLRAAKAESEKVIDRLTSELREVTLARNNATQQLEDLRIKLNDTIEDVSEWQKKHADAMAARQILSEAVDAAHSDSEALRDKIKSLQEQLNDAASNTEKQLVELQARVVAAEEESSSARSVRTALEKAMRAANSEVASLKEVNERLELQIAEGTAEKQASTESVEGARNELHVIAQKATESLRQKDEVISRMKQMQKELQLKERRRQDVDSAVELVRGGADLTKYKIVGRKVDADVRFVAVAPIATISPAFASSVAGTAVEEDPESAYCGDVLAWREPAKKTYTKAIRFGDIKQIVMGTESPVFARFIASHGVPPLDPTKCFSVITKANSVLLNENGKSTPLVSGATFDFSVATAAECTLWVFALRCLQLRAAGFGLYSLSKLAVKLERIGIKARVLAANADADPRAFLYDLAARAKGATRPKAARVATRSSNALSASGASIAAIAKASAKSSVGDAVGNTSRGSPNAVTANASTITPKPINKASVTTAPPIKPVEEQKSTVARTAAAIAQPSRSAAVDSPVMASHLPPAGAAPIIERATPKVAVDKVAAPISSSAPVTSASMPTNTLPPIVPRTAASKPDGKSSGGAAARAALFAGYNPKAEYVSPGKYAEQRKKETEKDVKPKVPSASDIAELLGVAAEDAPASAAPVQQPSVPAKAVTPNTSEAQQDPPSNEELPVKRSRVSRFAPQPIEQPAEAATAASDDAVAPKPKPASSNRAAAAEKPRSRDRDSDEDETPRNGSTSKPPARARGDEGRLSSLSEESATPARDKSRAGVDMDESSARAELFSKTRDKNKSSSQRSKSKSTEGPRTPASASEDANLDELIHDVEDNAAEVKAAVPDDYHWKLAQMREQNEQARIARKSGIVPVTAPEPATATAKTVKFSRLDALGRPRKDSDEDGAERPPQVAEDAESSFKDEPLASPLDAHKGLFQATKTKSGFKIPFFGRSADAAAVPAPPIGAPAAKPTNAAPKPAAVPDEEEEDDSDDDDLPAAQRKRKRTRKAFFMQDKSRA